MFKEIETHRGEKKFVVVKINPEATLGEREEAASEAFEVDIGKIRTVLGDLRGYLRDGPEAIPLEEMRMHKGKTASTYFRIRLEALGITRGHAHGLVTETVWDEAKTKAKNGRDEQKVVNEYFDSLRVKFRDLILG